MATFTKRPSGVYAQVRRKGEKSIGRTFDTRADAERWALQVEASMGLGTYQDNRETLSTSLAECIERYSTEIMPDKKGADRDKYRAHLWLKSDLAKKGIGAIKQSDIAKWRDARIASGISGGTVTKDLAFLSHVFTIAIKEWGFPLVNPVLQIRKPKPNPSRDRRLTGNEEHSLFDLCGTELKAFIILAIETAMRRGEIVSIKRSWIRGPVVYLPDTKNGSPRAVPLSKAALEAIASLPPRFDGKLFEFKADAYTKGFIRICRSLGIEDLKLHDLRHEGTSRLFEKGLTEMQAMSITGHKSSQMLSRYTHLKASDLAKLLG